MDARVSEPVRLLLEEYLNHLDQYLPGSVLGVYLHGSLALKAFDSKSDVDFLTLVNHDLNCEELAKLTDLHGELIDKYPSLIMQGSYIKWLHEDSNLEDNWGGSEDHFFRLKNGSETPYFDGFMMTYSKEGLNNPITWWLIKECGICLKGLSPSSLSININDEVLTRYVIKNMNEYWRRRVERFWHIRPNTEIIPQIELDFEVEWIVLGLLRQYFTLRELSVISKLEAAEYGLKTLPQSFHQIIEEAIQIRKGSDTSLFNSNYRKIKETYKLSHYIFDWAASNQHDVYS